MLVLTKLKRYTNSINTDKFNKCILNTLDVGIYNDLYLTSIGRDYACYITNNCITCCFFNNTYMSFKKDEYGLTLWAISLRYPSKIMNTDVIVYYKDNFDIPDYIIYELYLDKNKYIIINNILEYNEFIIKHYSTEPNNDYDKECDKFILSYKNDKLVEILHTIDGNCEKKYVVC